MSKTVATFLLASLSQAAFTFAAILFRRYFLESPHGVNIGSWWLWAAIGLEVVGIGLLFAVVTTTDVGRTFAMMGAIGILLASIMGAVFIGDTVTVKQATGIGLAMLSIFLMI